MSDFGTFIDLLSKSRRMVALTGAGVSTLSGIPDFRSSEGLYSREFGSMRVEDILDIDFFKEHPDVFYQWARPYWYQMDKYEPNIIHRTLAVLEGMGTLTDGIFTQNIDSLDRKAGSKKVYELHGSLRAGYCMDCHSYYDYDTIARAVNSGIVPVCKQCGGTIKPDIVFYGEGLDQSLLSRGVSSFSYSDLVLVCGSSLIVNPAASLPYYSATNRKKIVIVNRDSTYLDEYASLRFDDLESFFGELNEHIVAKHA